MKIKTMNRKKRAILTSVLLLPLVIPPTWILYGELRQEKLDYALIEAIKTRDK